MLRFSFSIIDYGRLWDSNEDNNFYWLPLVCRKVELLCFCNVSFVGHTIKGETKGTDAVFYDRALNSSSNGLYFETSAV